MMMLDSLYRNGGGKMGFTGTGAANKNNILGTDKLTVVRRQLPHE